MTVGYYDQRQSGLEDGLTVLDQLKAFTRSHDEGYLRGVLARFLFIAQDVYKSVRMLSGGERSRLLLARLFCERPNFLVLDEPTNHLDIPSCEALEEALCEYDGTVLLVSHDRYFIDRVCNRLLMLRPGGWELVDGNYSRWRMLEEERAARALAASQEQAEKPAVPKKSAPPKRTNGSTATKVAGLNSYQLGKLTLADVEVQIHKAERQLGEIEKSFSDPAVFSDAGKMTDAQDQYDQVRAQIDRYMEVWQMKMEEGRE
jgi:ATP-binding cassette subfamily F protein 3